MGLKVSTAGNATLRGAHNGDQTLSAKAAAALDKELMSTGAFSIDQLMELAGLSVSQAGQSTAARHASVGTNR